MENLKSAGIGAVVALAVYITAQWLGSGRTARTPVPTVIVSAAPTPVSIIVRIEQPGDFGRALTPTSPTPVLTPTTIVNVRVLDSLPTIVIVPPPSNKPQSGTVPAPVARATVSPRLN